MDDCPLDDDSGVVFDLVSLVDIFVVLADSSTSYDSAEIPDVHQNLVQHFTSDIVEVNVDSLGAVLSKLFLEALMLVVDGLVSPN